jgi:type VI secretion system protein ImpJ
VADYQKAALLKVGDVARGAALFMDEARLGCVRCHSYDGKAGKAAPDLFAVGDKFGRREIIDSLLTPSAVIAEGYSTTILETKAGEEISGIVKDATGQWAISHDFYPPATTVSAISELQQSLRRLLDILLVKSQSLSGSHRERAKSVVEYGSTDISSFWLLHSVNRNFARLRHLSLCQPLHPEELYVALAEFCGELQTFSTLYSLADIPPYRHDQLQQVFPVLDRQIRELLETVISARYTVIPLHSPKPSFHIGRLESDRLLENVDFYLSVHSELPASQVIDNVPLKMKIGAPDDVEKILNSALRGVAIHHAAQTPSAVPVRVGNHYFAFEPHGDIFSRMLQSRSICIYMPQTLSNLTLELIAVFR